MSALPSIIKVEEAAMHRRNKILLLTLVHPDFLPPVWAIAQVLRDEGYAIEIVTFSSLIPAQTEQEEGIDIREIGQYHDQSFLQKIALRKKYKSAVEERMREQPVLIISFCTFSFLCGEAKRKQVPHAHLALEINNLPERLSTSPLTFLRNRSTFKNLPKADLVATPSIQRSAWLAGKSGLRNIPFTIQNVSYYKRKSDRTAAEVQGVLPAHFAGKKAMLYTGRIGRNYKVQEIVYAFGSLKADDAVLIITGFRADDSYCAELSRVVEQQSNRKDILLLPLIPREQLIALQAYAHIGICFVEELKDVLDTQLAAPNKIGEYIANGMYLLTNSSVYTSQFQDAGVATLIQKPTIAQISEGMSEALKHVADEGFSARVDVFCREKYCMQKEARPVIDFLKQRHNAE